MPPLAESSLQSPLRLELSLSLLELSLSLPFAWSVSKEGAGKALHAYGGTALPALQGTRPAILCILKWLQEQILPHLGWK